MRFLQVPTDRPVLPTPISRPGGTVDVPQTRSPTRRPTQAPSRSPIIVPTGTPPTRTPTRRPTRFPTIAPMVASTPRPVQTPVATDQTPARTLQPTLAPVPAPIVAPIQAPVSAPVSAPVAPAPVAAPTMTPMISPTPGSVQTPIATDQTPARTLQPTFVPTQGPTRTPVATPMVVPTPTMPLQPTRSPSDPSNVAISAGGSSTNIAGALVGGFAAFLVTGVCIFFFKRRESQTASPKKEKTHRPYGARPSITSIPSRRSGRIMAELMLPPQEEISTLGDPTFTSARKITAALENGEEPFRVVAPAGKLGMVLGTALDGGIPIVHAIKESSPLAERVRVGDRLLSVDGEECTGTASSPINAPELISRKSEKSSRVLIFARSVECVSDS